MNAATIDPALDAEAINAAISAPLLTQPSAARRRQWWIAFAFASALTVLMLVSIGVLFLEGIGIWGVNTQVVWGFAIANYVWWIGIGNAGTLISSLLLLTRQKWRAAINRFAEAMTLFAATIAGLFPILHLGRPYFFYWLAPYPNSMQLWPQWRSALVWDFWAIASYILFSLMFWYVGLLPDLATLRDRAHKRATQRFYGALALGWRGSARQWQLHRQLYLALAALAVPLVCSVHSVVGLDFAASLMPGWHESLFPPYFVIGAMYSGFAMIVVLAALIRRGLHLQALITRRHFDAMAKILLLCALIMGLSYASEWFGAWYGGEAPARRAVAFEFSGHYAPLYWLMLTCNVLLPQSLWWPRARASLPWLLAVALMINVGMWLERVLIILNTLSHSFMPGSWSRYLPTFWDWSLSIGTLGFFAFLFLLFVRLIPSVSMHEVRALVRKDAQ